MDTIRINKSGRFKLWMLVFFITVIAGISYASYMYLSGTARFTGKDKSIAVLPFVNRSGEKRNEYINDGITEGVISELTPIKGLRVIPRASAMTYKNTKKNLRQIGDELHVAVILEGWVQKSGSSLKMNTRLTDVQSGRTIGEDLVDPDLKDILSIQTKLARSVAARLNVGTEEEKKGSIPVRPTQNLEAYNQYLLGRYYYYQRRDSSLRKAIDCFSLAIQLDPLFSRAYSGLADSYAALGYISYELPSRAFLKAEAAAVRALQLDSTLAEPHNSLGYVKFYYYRDWDGAEQEFRKAIRLNPQYELTYDAYGYYLTAMERYPEAGAAMDKAILLDPLSAQINTDKGFSLYYRGDYDLAIKTLKSVLELNPAFPLAHLWLGRSYQEKKMYKEAIGEYEKTRVAIKDWPVALAAIGYVYGITGQQKEAEKMLARLQEISGNRYVTPYGIALIYAGLDNKDKTFEWLGKAFEERSNWLVWLKLDPRWAPVKNDRRYADLVVKVGLLKKSAPYIPQ